MHTCRYEKPLLLQVCRLLRGFTHPGTYFESSDVELALFRLVYSIVGLFNCMYIFLCIHMYTCMYMYVYVDISMCVSTACVCMFCVCISPPPTATTSDSVSSHTFTQYSIYTYKSNTPKCLSKCGEVCRRNRYITGDNLTDEVSREVVCGLVRLPHGRQ